MLLESDFYQNEMRYVIVGLPETFSLNWDEVLYHFSSYF